ncbi:hypothetical protein CRUP_033841 [Coryphaenoides rupestris]|nr:hypothetical protein CRUP_033841 [Coryphaenoides rupestris]
MEGSGEGLGWGAELWGWGGGGGGRVLGGWGGVCTGSRAVLWTTLRKPVWSCLIFSLRPMRRRASRRREGPGRKKSSDWPAGALTWLPPGRQQQRRWRRRRVVEVGEERDTDAEPPPCLITSLVEGKGACWAGSGGEGGRCTGAGGGASTGVGAALGTTGGWATGGGGGASGGGAGGGASATGRPLAGLGPTGEGTRSWLRENFSSWMNILSIITISADGPILCSGTHTGVVVSHLCRLGHEAGWGRGGWESCSTGALGSGEHLQLISSWKYNICQVLLQAAEVSGGRGQDLGLRGQLEGGGLLGLQCSPEPRAPVEQDSHPPRPQPGLTPQPAQTPACAPRWAGRGDGRHHRPLSRQVLLQAAEVSGGRGQDLGLRGQLEGGGLLGLQ